MTVFLISTSVCGGFICLAAKGGWRRRCRCGANGEVWHFIGLCLIIWSQGWVDLLDLFRGQGLNGRRRCTAGAKVSPRGKDDVVLDFGDDICIKGQGWVG